MITVIAWIVIIITLMQFLVALANLVITEKMSKQASSVDEHISILIPARNEEGNLGSLIEDILQQEYQNFELIRYDDQSEDGTAGVVKKYADSDHRIRLLTSHGLPDGWLGKNYACNTLAKAARGSYYLFLDADVRIKGDIIRQVMIHCKKHGLSLISFFPQQIMITLGEKLCVPVMNYILLSLLPLILVRRSSRASLAAANGQFMFFEAKDYVEQEPHRLYRANKVEDIAIARHYKERGLKISCQLGDERISCRMYSGFKEAVAGFSKNVIDFFGGHYLLAILFWFISTLGVIFVLVALPLYAVMIFLLLYLFTRLFISLRSRQNIIENILYLIPQQISMGIFITNAILKTMQKSHSWKGREIG